jgi:hypothetical protein
MQANFEKTFAIHEYGLDLGDLEAPLLKADHVSGIPFPIRSFSLAGARCD